MLLFNVGIELGQLAIVAVVQLLVAILPMRLKQSPIYLAGGVASFWFMPRAWLILLPAVAA